MKRVFIIGMIAIGLAAGGWKRIIGSSDSPLTPAKKVITSTASKVMIMTQVFGFTENDTTVDNKNFKRISIPEEMHLEMCDADDTILVGKPQIPYIRLLIAVPDSCQFNITTYESDYTVFKDYLLYPVPRIVFETDTLYCIYSREVFAYDTSFYEKDTLYPGRFFEVIGDGHWRHQRILEIRLYPVQYNPDEKAMYFYSQIHLQIDYLGNIYGNPRGLGPFENIGREVLLNYPLPGPGTMGISPPPQIPPSVHFYDSLQQCNVADYIIITHNDLLANETTSYWINEFGWWRVHHNKYDVGMVAMSDVYEEFLETAQGDSAQALRDFLVYAFDNWRAPHIADSSFAYCLFIGDWDYVPIETCLVRYQGAYVPGTNTDIWLNAYEGFFRDIDSPEMDSCEDIMLGRLPVKATYVSDLARILKKIIDYESNPDTGLWRRRGLLIAGGGIGAEIFYGAVNQSLPYFAGIGYDTLTLRWLSSDSFYFGDSIHWNLNRGEIITAYYGHGGANGWPPYFWDTSPYPDSLENGDSLSVILSYACNTAMFQRDHPYYDTINHPYWDHDSVFAEHLLYNPDGGAVAFFGATSPIWISSGTYNTTPIARVLRYQHWILGKALANTQVNTNNNCFCLLGDPALDLGDYTAFPDLPDLIVPSGGISISIMAPHPYHTGGGTIPLSARVYNVGHQPVNDVDVRFAVLKLPSDTVYRDVVTIPEILPRDTALAISYWNTSLTHPNVYGEIADLILVEVDPNNEIAESWEYNNRSSKIEKIVLYPNESGWPKKVINSGVDAPVLANLDGRDNAEIVYASLESLYVFKSDGTILEGWPKYFRNISGLVVGDLDCMGNLEIVAISKDSIKVYDYEGLVIWSRAHPETIPDYFSGMPATGYISGADKREIAIFNSAKSTTPKVLVYSYNGNLTRVFSAADTAEGGSESKGPAISDVNGDGLEEIVLSYETYSDHPGRPYYSGTDLFNITSNIPIDTLENIGNHFSIPALVDLNDDVYAEIITSRYNTRIMAYNPRTQTIFWETETYGEIRTSPSAGDINVGMGFPGNEIAFGNEANKIWAVRGSNGSWWYPFPLNSGGYVRISPALARLEGALDENVDILIASSDGNVVALNYEGDTVPPYPLLVYGLPSSPVIGDIDGDGKSETVIATGDGYLHVWENVNSEILKGLLEWPQFHHDHQRTGLYNWIGGLCGGDAHPKVFSTATTISFTLRDTANIQIKVYNTQGNPVKTLVNQIKPKGSYHVVWDGKNDNYALLPNGLYFIEFRVNNERGVIPVKIRR